MDRKELLKKLTEFLDEAMMGRAADVQPDDELAKIGLDSMGTVELVTQVEEEFELEELSSEEIAGIKTLNDAADLVLAKKGSQ